MSSQQRKAGLIQLKVNGEIYDAKGNFTCNLGLPGREPIVGADGVHGYKETPKAPSVEGEITDRGTLDLAALVSLDDATVTVQQANGKMFALYDAWFAGEGDVNTEEANIPVRFEGMFAEEIS